MEKETTDLELWDFNKAAETSSLFNSNLKKLILLKGGVLQKSKIIYLMHYQ
ncbi:MAG: hypothetical protein ACTSYC_10375 [Promethearchaeota archaeon]